MSDKSWKHRLSQPRSNIFLPVVVRGPMYPEPRGQRALTGSQQVTSTHGHVRFISTYSDESEIQTCVTGHVPWWTNVQFHQLEIKRMLFSRLPPESSVALYWFKAKHLPWFDRWLIQVYRSSLRWSRCVDENPVCAIDLFVWMALSCKDHFIFESIADHFTSFLQKPIICDVI